MLPRGLALVVELRQAHDADVPFQSAQVTLAISDEKQLLTFPELNDVLFPVFFNLTATNFVQHQ